MTQLIRLIGAAAIAVVVAMTSVMHAQDAQRFERAGIRADAALSFYRLIRSAVGTSDGARVCGLIAYPLINADGTFETASDCESRYDTLFTVDVRRAIGKQPFDEIFVNDRGVMFGMGELWFAGRCAVPPCGLDDLRIVAINSRSAGLTPPSGKVLWSCHANGQLLHVLADGAGGASLRLWRSGRADGAPTVVVSKPAEALTDGRCGAREWTFADGTTRFTALDLSCDAYLSPPPMGSVGELVVKREGRDDVRMWCEP